MTALDVSIRSERSYKIKYPSTTNDDGTPTDDLYNDCCRILRFVDDERHLLAKKLYSSVLTRFDEHPGKEGLPAKQGGLLKRKKLKKEAAAQEEEYNKISAYLETNREALEKLVVRGSLSGIWKNATCLS